MSSKLLPVGKNIFTKVDEEDFKILSLWKWRLTQKGYVGRCQNVRGLGRQWLSLANYLMSCPVGKIVDHINHDILDNRRENLRICYSKENSRNRKLNKNSSTGFKGVVFRKDLGVFRARVSINGKRVTLGHFNSAEEAAKAYDKAAIEIHGKFACLNFK